MGPPSFMLLATSLSLAARVSATADATAVTLTWETCVAEALRANPSLRQARADLAAARDRRNAAFGGFLPRAGASLTASDGATEKRLWYRDLNASWSARLTASQSLFSGFATLADVTRAAAAARLAAARAVQAEADVRQRLRRAFVDVLFGQANVEVQTAIARRSLGNADLVRLRYEGGREDKGSAMRAEAVARRAGFEEARARRALTLARRRLAQLLGRDAVGNLAVSGTWAVDAPPAAPDLDTLARVVPAVVEAESSVDEAHASVWSAVAPFWPDLDANASAGRDGPGWFPDRTRNWSAGVSASWNLFNGGRDAFGLAAAREARESAEAGLAGARREARTSLEAAWVGWQDADEELAVNRQFLEATRARAEIGRAQYANGRLGFQEWTQIEDEVVSAERNEVAARRDALNAEAGWREALGRGFAE